MSIKFVDDLTLDIYIKKDMVDFKIFDKKEMIEEYFKNIVGKLKKIYKIELDGFYNVIIYVDKYYGAIFHLEKEKLDYYDYFKGELEIKIVLKKVDFLYLVDTIEYFSKEQILSKNGNLYIKLSNDISKKDFMNLLEHSTIVYNEI